MSIVFPRVHAVVLKSVQNGGGYQRIMLFPCVLSPKGLATGVEGLCNSSEVDIRLSVAK